jgi:hypothetical protein
MQLTLKDVAVRGAGVAWKGDGIALGVKFEAPFSPESAKQLGVYDNVFNGNGGPRKFVAHETGLAVPDCTVTVTIHPEMEPWAFTGKLADVDIITRKGGLHVLFRLTVKTDQPIMKYIEQQKREPVFGMQIDGMTQSSLDLQPDDMGPDDGPKKRGRPKKKK